MRPSSFAEWSSGPRRSGDVLTLAGLPTNLAVTDPVDIVLGCNRKPFASSGGDCQALHNNLPNFGGQPWIPLKGIVNTNPFY
jgi:hypothetical protein